MSLNKQWKETSWQDADDSKTIVTITQVLHTLKDEPVVLVKLADLSHILDLSHDGDRVAEANLSWPITVSYTHLRAHET